MLTLQKIRMEKQIWKSGTSFWILYFCLLCIVGIFFTWIGVTDAIPDMVSLFVTIIGTITSIVLFKLNESDRMAAFIMFCGYMVRMVYRYGTELGILNIEYSSAPKDCEAFWIASSDLYAGNFVAYVPTKYPYVLKWFYEVFGCNRYLAEYTNILFWVLCSVILIKVGKRANFSGTKKYVLYVVWAILPCSILVGSELLRENIMVFFDMFSFYMFLDWMERGRKSRCIWAFLLVAPAAYLHTASIALWAAYIVVAAFWDSRKDKFRFMRRTMILLFAGFIGAGLILFSPLNGIFGAYIGGNLSIYGITHRPYEVGGSDYLQWMDCQNGLQFIPYTLLRMFYFLFSPVPWEARGIVDLISFALDGLLVLVLLVYIVKQAANRQKKPYLIAAMLCVLAFAGIFAWGVRNAGTAMRHRMLVWGILIMGSCIAMGDTFGWKETENEKKDSAACAEKQ